MSDTLAQRIEKARNTMSQLPDWISFNARFEGGENQRNTDMDTHTAKKLAESATRSFSNNAEITAV